MRRAVIVAVLVCLLSVPVVASEIDPTTQPAFRDLYWGDPIWKLGEDAIFLTKSDGLEMWSKRGDILALGSVPVEFIFYGFFEGKLYTVTWASKEIEKTRDMLVAKYGEPIQKSPLFVDASWVYGDTLARFRHDIVKGEASVILLSMSIADDYEAWRNAQAKRDAASW